MTDSQRAALLGQCEAILACSCCPPDIRFRAENLRAHVARDYSRRSFADLFQLWR